METPALKSEFSITINFDKNSRNPSRVFEAMSGLIKAFQELDRDLIKSIDNRIEPVLMLEDVESGSIKAWLTNFIKGIPDEAVKDGDWKKVIGHFLLKAKYILLTKLEGKALITDKEVIEDIQYEIVQEAIDSGAKQLPLYTPMTPQKIVKHIDAITKALEPLSSSDAAYMTTPEGSATFNLDLRIDPVAMQDLITAERLDNESTMILKVKKPDYLGFSMWEFKHGSKIIQATISDQMWLSEFQSQQHDIRPGDSIRARVVTTLRYGFDLSLLSTSYEIVRVETIIRYTPGHQTKWDDQEEVSDGNE